MTLEQLIEACGEENIRVTYISKETKKRKWFASYWKGENFISKYGSTPTKAVQKLYDYLKENNLLNNN